MGSILHLIFVLLICIVGRNFAQPKNVSLPLVMWHGMGKLKNISVATFYLVLALQKVSLHNTFKNIYFRGPIPVKPLEILCRGQLKYSRTYRVLNIKNGLLFGTLGHGSSNGLFFYLENHVAWSLSVSCILILNKNNQ